MKQISSLIIGAGQAGLAMSHCLTERAIDHVLIERGEIANSWATERWESLRLLTPNWQSRMPGQVYDGPSPDGYMSMTEISSYLQTYAARGDMPVETRTRVLSVSADGQGYRVITSRGEWRCDAVILANGACAIPKIPLIAQSISESVRQLTPLDYRTPAQLSEGGVLVVGASASGVQIASELQASGRPVILAASHHIRVPRHYRGRDIQWWMDRSGIHDQHIDEVDDPVRARSVPSLQLVGRADVPFMDINFLQAQGVEVTGRLAAIRDGVALFSGGLRNACALSDLKMRRLLRGFDNWANNAGLVGLPAPGGVPGTELRKPHRLSLDLKHGSIHTVIWATGFKPDFSWLDLPVFDAKNRLMHQGGIVAPGLYALGLPFLRRRKSALLDGVGTDATWLADHLTQTSCRLAA